jgi:hypothetical protein
VTLIELLNSAALLAVVGLGFRTEARLTRLETIIESLKPKKETCHG